MRHRLRPTLGIYRIALLASAFSVILVMVLSARSMPLRAQLTGTADVIYRECYRDRDGAYGRFEECGIDQRATQEHQRKLAELDEKVKRATRPVTPEEEQKISDYLQNRFGGEDDLQAQLTALLDDSQQRLLQLMESDRYAFNERERETIQSVINWIDVEKPKYGDSPMTKSDMRLVRNELGTRLGTVAEIVTANQRQLSGAVPQVENLVTRIDDLVARVGTVIRDLERSGQTVPVEIRTGHRTATELVRDAKFNCSTDRPTGCTQLRTVLETLEGLRVPLCELDSTVLTFCS